MLRQRTIILAALLVLGGAVLLTGSVSHAATATSFSIESIGDQAGLGSTDLKQLIINIIRWALGMVTLAAVGYMIYGGILWMTSRGNEKQVEKAKQVILQAAIGLVIILLAWAIVFFVVRTFVGVTSNTNGSTSGGGCTDIASCSTPTTNFNITAANTCAVPNDGTNVPRSSAVSFTFNKDLKVNYADLPNDPVYLALNSGTNPLRIKQCTSADCTCSGPSCSPYVTPEPDPIQPQVYTPATTPAGAAGSTKAEWLAIHNTLTFYHLSFSDNATSPDYKYFKPNTTYRVFIPRATAAGNNPLRDTIDRVLSYCRRAGDMTSNIPRCDDSSDPDNILYTFTTGAADNLSGQPLAVNDTYPSSTYLTNTALTVDRNVPRSSILSINFNGALDPATVLTQNFRVYKITGVPDNLSRGTCGGNPCPGTELDQNLFDIRVNGGGNGALLQLKSGNWFEPFTWYRVVVENMRNLCGTAAPKQEWTFETNNATPGVDFVYPSNEFPASCPSTEVFAQFRTTMMNIADSTTECTLGADSSFNTRAMIYDTTTHAPVGRTFSFTDAPTASVTNPNNYCKRLSLASDPTGLPVQHTYNVGIQSDIVINQDRDTLEYGDAVPGFTPKTGTPPWHFTTQAADRCYQAPYISSISPSEDKNGACLSITGNYFEKVNFTDATPNQPETGDTLTFGGVDQIGPGAVKSWTNGYIVDKLNAGSLAVDHQYDFQVGVAYPAPVSDVLKSPISESSKFMLRSGGPDRPCLTGVNPSQGYTGDTFVATGENLGNGSGASEIRTDNHSPWSHGAWSSTLIADITVPNTALNPYMSHVSVRNAAGVLSNELPYNVLQRSTGPGGSTGDVPAVVEDASCSPPATIPSPNPYRDATGVCRNLQPTVRFNIALDGATITPTSVQMYNCTSGCTLIPSEAKAIGNTVTVAPGTFAAPTVLDPATPYEVRMTTAIRGTVVTGHNQMAAPYTWRFTTTNNPDLCQIDNVVVTPNGNQTTNDANYPTVGLLASTINNACYTLTHAGIPFQWTNTQNTVGELTLPTTTNDANSLQHPATGAQAGETTVKVSAQSHESIPGYTLKYDPTICTVSSDCATNGLGESCGTASSCVAGHCTPVINSLDKTAGPLGTWTTIRGCWFGAYNAASSKVNFIDQADGTYKREGLVPDPALCGTSQWTNERITREVPNVATTITTDDAHSGPVEVIRSDGVSTSLASGFTVNTDPLAIQLCKAVPTSGVAGSTVIVSGHGFGTQTAGTDTVTYQSGANIARSSVYPAPGWQTTSIAHQVPVSATIGTNNICVIKNGTATSSCSDVSPNVSNTTTFNVTSVSTTPPSCTRCEFGTAGDSFCSSNPATPGTVCGYPDASLFGCCVQQPHIIDVAPPQGSTNMCRNIVAQITFDQPLDPATVTKRTVHYIDNHTPIDGQLGLRNDAGTGVITYAPGAVTPNHLQTLTLDVFDEQPVGDFLNGDFENWISTTTPSGYTAVSAAKKDVGHDGSGSSGLADCQSAGCPGQAFIAQTLPEAGANHCSNDRVKVCTSAAQCGGGTCDPSPVATDPIGTQYHLTGWVKVEQPAAVKSGLITQCAQRNPATGVMGFVNCGYDDPVNATGLFTGPSNGWKYIDTLVKKTSIVNSVLHVNCFAQAGAKVWCDNIQVTKIAPATTAIRATTGAIANTAASLVAPVHPGTPLTFTTGTNICTIDSVKFQPTDSLFTAKNEVHNNFQADAISRDTGTPVMIAPITGKYEWTWSWGTEKPAVATVGMSTVLNANPSKADVTAVANGTTAITATATVGIDTYTNTTGRKIDGQGNVSVKFCANPWKLDPMNPVQPVGFTDVAGNCDVNPAQCQGYHFSMFYCRDRDTTPLPNFNYAGSGAPVQLGSIEGLNAVDATRLKTFFFKESATSHDTIGLMIFKNDEFLSPYDWFKKRFPLDTSGASTTIGGYPAVKSGTTTYIGVTDLDNATNQLRGLMFVFDYNSNNASPDTVDIATQMIDSLAFNTNLLNAQEKGQLIRDTRRRQDLTSLTNLLNSFKSKNGAYPSLTSGTFIPGFSTSLWPSWQATLGADLGSAVPTDPVNAFSSTCTAPYEGASCWSESDKKFSCPANSKLYALRSSATGGVDVYTTMEYSGSGSFIPATAPSGICSSPSTCDCFNYGTHLAP